MPLHIINSLEGPAEPIKGSDWYCNLTNKLIFEDINGVHFPEFPKPLTFIHPDDMSAFTPLSAQRYLFFTAPICVKDKFYFFTYDAPRELLRIYRFDPKRKSLKTLQKLDATRFPTHSFTLYPTDKDVLLAGVSFNENNPFYPEDDDCDEDHATTVSFEVAYPAPLSFDVSLNAVFKRKAGPVYLFETFEEQPFDENHTVLTDDNDNDTVYWTQRFRLLAIRAGGQIAAELPGTLLTHDKKSYLLCKEVPKEEDLTAFTAASKLTLQPVVTNFARFSSLIGSPWYASVPSLSAEDARLLYATTGSVNTEGLDLFSAQDGRLISLCPPVQDAVYGREIVLHDNTFHYLFENFATLQLEHRAYHLDSGEDVLQRAVSLDSLDDFEHCHLIGTPPTLTVQSDDCLTVLEDDVTLPITENEWIAYREDDRYVRLRSHLFAYDEEDHFLYDASNGVPSKPAVRNSVAYFDERHKLTVVDKDNNSLYSDWGLFTYFGGDDAFFAADQPPIHLRK